MQLFLNYCHTKQKYNNFMQSLVFFQNIPIFAFN